jgi:hypothetical protein
VTEQKAVVESYTEGFRTGDLAKIVSCLTDDVVWELHGDKTLVGKDAFAAEDVSGDGDLRGSARPVTDILLTMYRRVPLGCGRIEVIGDAGLVDFWLERVSFG